MNLQGRALYNLIRFGWEEDPTIGAKDWQREDLRVVSTSELFRRLRRLAIDLDEKSFREYAKNEPSPEELVHVLWIGDVEDEAFEKGYLLLFELWRRLLPEQQSLSVFCDQLDYLLHLYDQNKLENDEDLQTALVELEGLLEKNIDQGSDPQELFALVNSYCAHDLESFIYDYAADQINAGQTLLASELIDGFCGYMANAKWFDFLRCLLLFDTDEEEATVMLERLLEELREDPDLDLLLEVARFLVKSGSPKLFLRVMHQARSLIETEEDFQELIALSCEFSRLLEKEESSKRFHQLLEERKSAVLEQEIRPNDKAVDSYYHLLSELA